ncbi:MULTISPECIES: LPS assembly lipoprotein LptE [Rodentibacter]|uniref:LPS-assembly lipoprotein LptE n=1 Tax=Rodentibacter TaxID=1960084 RepID=UPI001CFCFC1F|nr:LPS assembly lipoprotein LptE [Rodentibacter sp. JRC1]GJI55438.1 LPS-assembly lipoprotein LptE [Rodentibacter sp. JRC1]
MLNSIKKLVLISGIVFLSACGWHFQNGALIPQELRTIAFESSDPYSEMSMTMRRQLQANDVKLVNATQGVPVLRINKQTTNDQVASIFKRGREAEKLLLLEVEASVRLANGDTYPITAKVNRTFFDNSRAALAKSAERDVIWNDMRDQAARQLITKMVALQQQVKGK